MVMGQAMASPIQGSMAGGVQGMPNLEGTADPEGQGPPQTGGGEPPGQGEGSFLNQLINKLPGMQQ